MNLTMMLFLHDFSVGFDEVDDVVEDGPNTPRPEDPSPEGGEGEPVGDDDDDEREDRGNTPPRDVD